MKVDAILLKPLDGLAVGSPRSFDKSDFERLEALSAVRRAGDDDAKPEAGDEKDALLAQLRDPVEGPKLIDSMKSSFEGLQSRLDDAEQNLRTVTDERDALTEAASTHADTLKSQDERIAHLEGERDAAVAELKKANEASGKVAKPAKSATA